MKKIILLGRFLFSCLFQIIFWYGCPKGTGGTLWNVKYHWFQERILEPVEKLLYKD